MQIAVRGVSLSVSDDDLKNHFGRYGEVEMVEDLHWKLQDSDGKQAFVFFADDASAKRASASREKNNHIILGKLVEVSRFSIWLQQRRIEVYNLSPGTTSSAFRAYFEEFGTVTEAVVGPDGSGYVVFKWDESLRKVLRKKLHLFYGTELKVRRESPWSEAFLVANAAQHEPAGATSSATPYARGVAYIPTRPVYTDSTPSSSSSPAAAPATVPGKIFVGGISPDTDEAALKEHFERYGKVERAVVVRDWSTGNSRGFGFVTFADDSADAAISASDEREKDRYIIDGKKVDVKRAIPKEHLHGESSRSNSCSRGQNSKGKKIFVGGLPKRITDGEFREYFEKFGVVTDSIVMHKHDHDHAERTPRGFGFVTFASEESAREALKDQFRDLHGKKIEIKRAVPKIVDNNSNPSPTRRGNDDASNNNNVRCNSVPTPFHNFNAHSCYGSPPYAIDYSARYYPWQYWGDEGMIRSDTYMMEEMMRQNMNLHGPVGDFSVDNNATSRAVDCFNNEGSNEAAPRVPTTESEAAAAAAAAEAEGEAESASAAR
ncbi:Heterogeneous nuclear ribonucleoprotein 1 [Ananas comosus]|uniref:Heterogeneous nuclear ribonucleoprotein 1 n=1 Tax=Ananas comosus TaxID=4615 RepID=A0A199WA59_ANACO|nr:Heterogeneous nuclear ribonucleoprotein 1 [Ananas comosus]